MCKTAAFVGTPFQVLSSISPESPSPRTKARPACLHGIASVHLGDDHFQRLRIGAVQGIGEHSPGTSPPIHLSPVEPVATDPQFHALVTTVMMLYLSSEHAEFCFEELHLPRKAIIPLPGPMSVMLARLHQIGWYWGHGTLFWIIGMTQFLILTVPSKNFVPGWPKAGNKEYRDRPQRGKP